MNVLNVSGSGCSSCFKYCKLNFIKKNKTCVDITLVTFFFTVDQMLVNQSSGKLQIPNLTAHVVAVVDTADSRWC